jgi:hypothetical protein
MRTDRLNPGAADGQVDHVAVDPELHQLADPGGAEPELLPADRQVPRRAHNPLALDRLLGLAGRTRYRHDLVDRRGHGFLCGANALVRNPRLGGRCIRDRLEGRWQPQRQHSALLSRHGREPLRRGDRRLLVEGLVRPIGVVLVHPRIDGGLSSLDRFERALLVEELGTEGAWHRSTFPFWFGEASAVSRWVIPLRRQILSDSTSPALPNRSVNCFPLSVITSSGTPNAASACANAKHIARPVACSTTDAMTQYREWSPTPVTSLASRTAPVTVSTSWIPPTMSIPHSCIGPGRSNRTYALLGFFRGRGTTNLLRRRIRWSARSRAP